jgi:hypothetical protein
MKKIHKYIMVPHTELDLPFGAEFLSVQEQRGYAVAWFLVDDISDTNRVIKRRVFNFYGTGHQVPDNPGRYLGTFQLKGGMFVFHLFEVF